MDDSERSPRVLPYSTQSVDEDDIRAVDAVLESDWLTTGPTVREFERRLSSVGGVRHALAVNSGTAALHCAYAGAGLGPGDEIVTSPLTFVATASTALLLGAKVRFADVLETTGCIDPGPLAAALGSRTKLVVAVDYAGHPADYDALRQAISSSDTRLISDAAHSFGASYRGEPVGSLADATTLSFHPVKSITTGEGGAVLTSDDDWHQRAARFRNHGIVREPGELARTGESWYYEVQSLGLNYRIPDILCALGLRQLEKLERFVERRRALARRYEQALAGESALILPVEEPHVRSSWHLYVLRVREAARRDHFFRYLRENRIGVQVHYMPVYLHPVFERMGYRAGLCPVAELFASQAVSIPLFPSMTNSDVDRVIETVVRGCRATL